MQKLKIGIIISRVDRGASELLEMNLGIELSKLGHYVYVFPQFSKNRFEDEEDNIFLLKEKGIKVLRLNQDKKFLLFRSLKAVRDFSLDFIISHNRGGNFLAKLISAHSKTKSIVAFHEYYSDLVNSGFLNWVWKYIIKNSDYSYHITTKVLENNRIIFGLNVDNSIVVINSINQSKTYDSHFEKKEEKAIILTVARMAKNKGIINNLNIIKDELLNNDNLIYCIAGETTEDPNYFKEVTNVVSQLGLKGKVKFLGVVNNVYELMQASEVLLHFACHEGFGLVLVEAINAGLPVIASNVGGIPEVLAGTEFTPIPHDNISLAKKRLKEYLSTSKKLNLEMDYKNYLAQFTHYKRAKKIEGILYSII